MGIWLISLRDSVPEHFGLMSLSMVDQLTSSWK